MIVYNPTTYIIYNNRCCGQGVFAYGWALNRTGLAHHLGTGRTGQSEVQLSDCHGYMFKTIITIYGNEWMNSKPS